MASCVLAKQRFMEFQRVLNGGIKSRFEVILNLPPRVSGDVRTFTMMVQSTSVPSMSVNPIETKYMGKTMQISGNETAGGDWSCTTLLNNSGRKAEAKRIADEWEKLSACSADINDYMSDAEVRLLAPFDLSPILRWRVENIWVSNSGELSLDHTNDEIMQFDITFNYFDVIPLHV